MCNVHVSVQEKIVVLWLKRSWVIDKVLFAIRARRDVKRVQQIHVITGPCQATICGKERCSAIRDARIRPLLRLTLRLCPFPTHIALFTFWTFLQSRQPRGLQLTIATTHTDPANMPGPFSSKSFSATLPNSIAAKYRKALQKHPFALFGLPFMATIVAGSFMLTPATALRYERYDRKNQQITQEQAMGLRGERRKVNMKDEYYVSTWAQLGVAGS